MESRVAGWLLNVPRHLVAGSCYRPPGYGANSDIDLAQFAMWGKPLLPHEIPLLAVLVPPAITIPPYSFSYPTAAGGQPGVRSNWVNMSTLAPSWDEYV